jgi:immune inhibitor A
MAVKSNTSKGTFSILKTFLILLLVCCFVEPVLSSPPHQRILKKYLEVIKTNPDLDPAELRKRGIDTPATYPDGKPIYTKGRGPSGTINALAILVEFTDKTPGTTAAFFDTLIFAAPPSVSVRDYYDEISYGILDIVTVNLPSALGWNLAPQTYAYYCNGQYGFGSYPQNAQRLVEDIVAAVDPLVNFANYDNDGDNFVDALFVVHAGQGAEWTGSVNDIWSHKWQTWNTPLVDGVYVSTYSMECEYWATPGDMTIGVYCHELGHVFGLPDWYDYGYDSAGLGRWCLMAGGSWNGANGASPAHVTAEGRWRLGFVTPVMLANSALGVPIPQVETNQAGSVFYVWSGGASNNEYFLVENRQAVGYDAALPGHGLFIYHVDDYKSGNNNQCTDHQNCNCSQHYEVALEQADGLLNLEKYNNSGDAGDPYPGTSNNTTFNLTSTPNSGAYSDCSSTVSITNISASAATMYADIGIQPDTSINANGSAGPISITQSDTLQIKVSLTTYGSTANADFWLAYKTASGWFHYDNTSKTWQSGLGVTHQGPMMDINNKKAFQKSGLAPGVYTFYFGVDMDMNGKVTKSVLYKSEVQVTVTL